MWKTRRELEDEWLVLASQEGNADAFNCLVSRWQKPLLRKALRLTGRDDLAADAMQDAWLAIIKGINRLQNPAKFASWAGQIVHRKSCNLLTSEQRSKHAIRVKSNLQVDTESSNVASENLKAAIKGLHPRYRDVLKLHYRDLYEVAEIADILGSPVGTVKSRLHQARELLRNRLNELSRKRSSKRS